MKKSLILIITVILGIVCGCTQSSTPVQPTTIVSTPEQTILPLTPTTFPPLPSTASVSANTVRIKNFAFDPSNITVKVGSTVRWVNQDSFPHRIQFADPDFSQILLASTQSGSQRFDQPGVYDYICSIHTDMRGTVTVER